MNGALLEDVWPAEPQQQQQQLTRRQSPGSGSNGWGQGPRRRQRQQQQQRCQMVEQAIPGYGGFGSQFASVDGGFGSQFAPVPNSKACGDGGPLCDMFTLGYSPALDDAMQTTSDLSMPSGSCMAFPSARGQQQPPQQQQRHRRQQQQQQQQQQPMQPIDEDLKPLFAQAIDFYDLAPYNNDDNGYYEREGGEGDGDSDGDGDGDGDAGAGVIARGSGSGSGSRHQDKPEKEKQAEAPPSGSGSSSRRTVSPLAFAMDMALYIVSGVVLIFLLEQFIQIGMRLRPYPTQMPMPYPTQMPMPMSMH
jgi:hypothetical protein